MSDEQIFTDDEIIIDDPTPTMDDDDVKQNEEETIKAHSTRIQLDFEEAQRYSKEQGYTVELINNDYELWSVKFNKFDNLPIYDDMQKYKEKYGRDYLELIFTFPPNYPFIPPFVRVYQPRFVSQTGHVTLGGSVCMGSLTLKGWNSTRTASSLIPEVFAMIMTGEAGDKPPQLDLSNDIPYDLGGAIEGYRNAAKKHKWEIPAWLPTK